MTQEELLKKLREKPSAFQSYEKFEYKGIKVRISRDKVLITPAGKNFSLEDSRKNIQNCLDQMPNGKTLEGVPREVWLEWMRQC